MPMPYRTPSYAELCWYIIRFKLKEVFRLPRRPKMPCAHPGCPALVEPGTHYCKEHKALHPEYTRSASRRGYGSKWQRMSKAFLQKHPLCVECMKEDPPKYVAATVVDHIVPHRGNQKLFWDKKNWQSLCKKHHDIKTLTEEVRQTYTY